jgi:hypothetical protein
MLPATKNDGCMGQRDSAKNNDIASSPNSKPTRNPVNKDRLRCVCRNQAKQGNTKTRKAIVEMTTAKSNTAGNSAKRPYDEGCQIAKKLWSKREPANVALRMDTISLIASEIDNEKTKATADPWREPR